MRRIGLAVLMSVALLVAPFDVLAGEGAKGWYLLPPPVDETSNFGHGVLDQAPLTKWTRIGTYDTEAACDHKRSEAIEASRDETLRLSKTSPLHHLALMSSYSDTTQAGGLVSYSADHAAYFRRAAIFVDKILKGAKPADLPVEQPTKFELVVNVKTAKALGLAIPQTTLLQADQVIDP